LENPLGGATALFLVDAGRKLPTVFGSATDLHQKPVNLYISLWIHG
jgi:hypothetical protein